MQGRSPAPYAPHVSRFGTGVSEWPKLCRDANVEFMRVVLGATEAHASMRDDMTPFGALHGTIRSPKSFLREKHANSTALCSTRGADIASIMLSTKSDASCTLLLQHPLHRSNIPKYPVYSSKFYDIREGNMRSSTSFRIS